MRYGWNAVSRPIHLRPTGPTWWRCSRWLCERKLSLAQTGRAELIDFIAARVQAGARPRSTARQLSSFRRFFRYLMREGRVPEDPTAQIAMPKIGRSLPRSLSEAEVESLLARR